MFKLNQCIKTLSTSLFMTLFVYVGANAQTISIIDEETFIATSAQDSISAEQQDILLGLLEQSFQSLADDGRRGRRTGGFVLLGLGIGSAVGGAATLAFGEGDDARIVGYSLLGGGAFFSGLSLLPFKIKTESERIYQQFNQMPENTPREIRQKYAYWDRRFGELARKWRRERIIGGISSIVSTGIASIAIAQSSDVDDPNAYIWPAVGGLIGGVSSFLIETEKERQYKVYRSAKEEILDQSKHAEIKIGIAPGFYGGFLTTVHVRF
jgi:hypothetical protein